MAEATSGRPGKPKTLVPSDEIQVVRDHGDLDFGGSCRTGLFDAAMNELSPQTLPSMLGKDGEAFQLHHGANEGLDGDTTEIGRSPRQRDVGDRARKVVADPVRL